MKPAGWHRASWALTWLVSLQVALLMPLQSCQPGDAVRAAHHVRYVLEWKRGTVRDLAPAGGWEVVNDLGFTVRVTRAYVVSRSIELVPCAPRAVSLRRLERFFSPPPALAGHGTSADPSASPRAEVESLAPAAPRELARVYPGARTYCRAHYLMARADAHAAALPADVDMIDRTLRIAGHVQPPDAAGFTPFAVATAVANGTLVDLHTTGVAGLDSGRASAVIVVRRNLDTIFDRVDFGTMTEKRMAREILHNLIAGVEIEVRVDPDEP